MVTMGIVGAGGDGVVLIGEILLKAAAKQGYYGRMTKIYDAVIKGGGSAVRLTLDAKEISGYSDLDILLVLDWEKYRDFSADFKISEKTFVLSEKGIPPELNGAAGKFLETVDFSEIAVKETGAKKAKNMLIVGLLADVLGLSNQPVKAVMESKFAKKPEDLEKNLSAFWRGGRIDLFPGQKIDLNLKLAKIAKPKQKIIIHGNEAIVSAAIKSGCGFYAGYPITPASEIMELMMRKLPEIGGAFIQSEDEIAALAMALGASFAGVKSMTATSGPGFSLMAEMFGLGVNCEIPAVVVNVQRGGPCTGMPTKSEQSDLNHAIFGGHGDGPRVVLAPYNLKSCHDLTIEAFNIAEEYQTPVILLSDQILSQTVQSVDDFTKGDSEIKERLKPTENKLKDYKRYRLTESGISPMAIPGTPGGEYQTRGLTHNEKGGPASASYEWQKKMHEKLRKKLEPLAERNDLVRIFGEKGAKIGIISWGSSVEAALAAMNELCSDGCPVKVLVPEIISPFPEKSISEFLKSIKALVMIEMNHSGQLFNQIKIHSYKHLPPNVIQINQVGGKMFDKKEIAGEIKKIAALADDWKAPWYGV